MSRSPFAVFMFLIAVSGCRFGNSHPHPKSPTTPFDESTISTSGIDELYLRDDAARSGRLPNGAKALLDSTVSIPETPVQQTSTPAPSPTPHPLGHPKPQHPLKKSLADDIGLQTPEPERRAAAVREALAQQAADQSAAAQDAAQSAAVDSLPAPKPKTASGGYGDIPSADASAASADASDTATKKTTDQNTEAADITVSSKPKSEPAASAEVRARLRDRSGQSPSLLSSFSAGGRTLFFEFGVLLLLVVVFFAVLWMRLDREFGNKSDRIERGTR